MAQSGGQGNVKGLFENKKLLTYADISNELGVSISMLRKQVMNGTIPHFKVGKLVRFVTEDIRAWLLKETHAS